MLHKTIIFSLFALSAASRLSAPQYYQYAVGPQQPQTPQPQTPHPQQPQQPQQPFGGNYAVGPRTVPDSNNVPAGVQPPMTFAPDGTIQVIRNGKLVLTNCRVCRLCCMGPIGVLPAGVTQVPQVPIQPQSIDTTPAPIIPTNPTVTVIPQQPYTPFAPVPASPNTPYPAPQWTYPTQAPVIVNQYPTPPQTTVATTTTTTQAPLPCVPVTTTSPATTTTRPPCQTVPVDTYPTPPPTTTTAGYRTAPPPAYPTVPELPTFPTTTPTPVQQCCTVELRHIQATVSCGTTQCCSQACTNQKTVTLNIPAPILGLPTKIPCGEAVAKGIVKESDVRGVCEQYATPTITPVAPAPEILIPVTPTGAAPSVTDSYSANPDGAYVTTPETTTSSASLLGALVTFIVASFVCF